MPGDQAAQPSRLPTHAPRLRGINKTGFIDNSDGANIRTGPAEPGGQKIRDQPLPPATRVFVSGAHPNASAWWYVTAYLEGTMVRGYVQDFRITTELPEPTANLHQVSGGETAEQLASLEYGSAVRDGHDLRYYENVLLYVNQQQHRVGISGSYQDPGVLGRGSNNVQLIAGHRIWLVSPADAKALEAVVPSGSLTGGAIAKVKRFVDKAKFEKYSMDPSNKGNGGKASAFRQIGYDIETEAGRQAGASDVVTQLKDQLKSTAAIKGKETGFGQRFEVRVRIKGPSGEGTLVTVWQLERAEPRLITNWLEVHK